jgi:hypothetical protein
MSILYSLIPEAIPRKKYHMNMSPILKVPDAKLLNQMKFHTQIARSFCQIGNKAPESGMWSNDM